MPRENVFAFTVPEGSLPDYISINTLEDTTDLRVTVRDKGVQSSINLERDSAAALYHALGNYLVNSAPDCPHAAPFRYCDGCKVHPCPVGLDKVKP